LQAKPQQSQQVLKLMDEVIDSVATQSASESQERSKSANADQNSNVTYELLRLRQQVSMLQQQVDYLLSFLGITQNKPVDTVASNNNKNSLPVSSTPTYASTAASAIPMAKLQGPIRNALLTAVYSDLQLKQSRNTHIVVTGLPNDMQSSDEDVFTDLCVNEFGITPVVERTQRLGKQTADRYQPLLVVLTTASQAERLLSMAKCLRASTDLYTSTHVFFAPHQTQAERQAAYETRCRRREARERRNLRDVAGNTPHQQPLSQTPVGKSHGFSRSSFVPAAESVTQPSGQIESSTTSCAAVQPIQPVAAQLSAAEALNGVPLQDHHHTDAVASSAPSAFPGNRNLNQNYQTSHVSSGSTMRVDVPAFTPVTGASGVASASVSDRPPDSGSCS
jgi:hypothetical protein